jgi:hypothetical protein
MVDWANDVAEGMVSVIVTNTVSGCRVRDDLDVIIIVPVGVERESETLISAYPNPTANDVKLQSESNVSYVVKVHDAMGREYFTDTLHPFGELSIPLRQAPSGVFIIELWDQRSRKSRTFKVIRK